MLNSVSLVGRLTRDPDLRYVKETGTAICKLNLAVDRGLSKEKREEAEQKGYQTADFINITLWGKIAESCANYLCKGSLISVQGKLKSGFYEKEGIKIYVLDVLATNVVFLEHKRKNNSDEDSTPEGFRPVDDSNIPF